MVGISNKCLYALRAILELSALERGTALSIPSIAKNQNIPLKFLESIMRELKETGFVSSTRGKEGGYSLAVNPGELSPGKVLRSFQASASRDEPACCFSELALKAEEAWFNEFDKRSFRDVLQDQKTQKMIPDFSI